MNRLIICRKIEVPPIAHKPEAPNIRDRVNSSQLDGDSVLCWGVATNGRLFFMKYFVGNWGYL